MNTLVTATTICLLAAAAQAQHSFDHTITVDPSGSADYTTIQGAINSLTSPSVRTTILIDAGEYAEVITLGSNRDNIDLVGVDRDSVLIVPAAVSPPNPDVVTIEGNGARNNSIRNLTIIAPDDDTTDEGRGIVVKDDGGAAPSDITIVGVRIETSGDSSPAIDFEDACSDIEIRDSFIRTSGVNSSPIDGKLASDVVVTGCDISTDDGRLLPGDDWTISWSFVQTKKDTGGCVPNDDTSSIRLEGHDNLIVDHCTLRGRGGGINIEQGSDNVLVSNCDIEGAHTGAAIRCATNVRFANCRIAANSELGKQGIGSTPEYVGVLIKEVSCSLQTEIVFSDCVISAYSDESSRDAIGVHVEDAPDDGPAQFLNCVISAEVTSDGDRAFGVAAGEIDADPDPVGEADSVSLIGGSVNAIDADERQTTLYDLYSESEGDPWILTTGTEFSRWVSPIGAAIGEEVEVLRVVDIPSAGASAVLGSTALLGVEQTITSNISDLEVFRVLSVTGNESDMDQAVIVIGRDWGLRPIADSITLSGTSTVNGAKAFRIVDKIILPARKDAGETVSVGTAEILGLQAPISETEDLLQIGKKESAATSYTLQSSVPEPSVNRGTVDVSSLSPADDDSIEFTYRASK